MSVSSWNKAACGAVVLLAGLLLLMGATEPSSGAKVAVANPVRIFNELQETKDLRAKLDQDQKNAGLTPAELQRAQKEAMASLYAKISDATAKVARDRGLDLVLAEQNPQLPQNLDQINPDQLRTLIGQRNVLFSSKAYDLSDAIILTMNIEYQAQH
jgi:Skp family chaperone for outer membrane proteins